MDDIEVVASSVGFLSKDGSSQVKGMIWKPNAKGSSSAAKARGIIQIVHGMSEHIGRYDDFARYLARAGFVVCANDHVGHGRSVSGEEDLGHIPVQGGKEILIEDVHQLRQIVASRYARTVPYIIFGHSMGSFIAYAYLARHGEGVAGGVICGTGRMPVAVSSMGNVLARFVAKAKGERHRSSLLHGLGAGGFSKKIPDARTPNDWICTDAAVVDAYDADPLCGQMFTAGGYATLTDLAHEVATPACARELPKDLPLLFIAGDGDPVGDFGAGIAKAERLVRDAGVKDVEVIVYPGMRHEILNEPGRDQVYRDVLSWVERRI